MGGAPRLHRRVRDASDGVARHYRTPLLFVGVGERALERSAIGIGARLPVGAHALHVLVVRAETPTQMLGLAFRALVHGVKALTHTEALDAFLVRECTVTMRRPMGTVSIDGELLRLAAALHYRIDRGAVNVIGKSEKGM